MNERKGSGAGLEKNVGTENPINLYRLSEMSPAEKEKILRRSRADIGEIKKQVSPIIEDVKTRGDVAVSEYLEKFDHVSLSPIEFRVSDKEKEDSYKKTPKELLHLIKEQIKLSRRFFKKEFSCIDKRWEIETVPGVKVGQKHTAIASAGLYVPGGTAPYPTVMQNLAVAAKIAGVERIIAVTPPRENNHAVIVAACEAGVDEIYKIGGVSAIAALTYGTENIKPVDKIVGPGNIFVTAAKLLVFGDVDIDMPAGPSEAIIFADEGADPAYCAADIMARAEHDENAAGVLVTWDKDLVEKTLKEINRQLPTLSRKKIIKEALKRYSGIILTKNREEAIAFTNDYAPEHLEVLTKNPYADLKDFKNAGSIFLGYNTPVAIGDYASGTGHILPTGGWAKTFSGVGITTFMKTSEVQSATTEGLRNLAPIIKGISKVEGLDAHWNSVEQRLGK
ncbi:MAG: histidinol dehydrogenase [Candidatus Levybacteria bacterium]|nr:histidinol dehydrogenase [Candidatus Levybacteria bacterium]MDZ4228283.1 histidinol dehydrogenase [Candidatus Levybacteria bacterium]